MVITEIDALATSLEEGILSVDVGFHSWSPRMLMGNASFIFQSPQFRTGTWTLPPLVTLGQAVSLTGTMPTPLPHPVIVKKKTNRFKRHQSDEYVKVKDSWRRPRGIDSRQRKKCALLPQPPRGRQTTLPVTKHQAAITDGV